MAIITSQKVKQKAQDLGFLLVGISRAEFMVEESRRLEHWLKTKKHGSMTYMENHFDLRTDPRKLVPGAKSVISLGYNYYNPDIQTDANAPKISMYAYGRDYHKVVKKKLKKLLSWMRQEGGDIVGRCFVDSAPVMERDWAKRSGLGWVGKHTLLINKQVGSFFFLAELIVDLALDPDGPVDEHCGTCTKCIDACPTDAISSSGYVLDSNRCISYLTIELKDAIPEEYSDKMENWMFGCDICQKVCPWNRFSIEHEEPDFSPKQRLMAMTQSEWHEITHEVFEDLFRGSAVKRTKYTGLKRNIAFLKSEN